jgi:hypothetical protein
MIDPASVGDWVQASLLVGLFGAVGALSASALREEHERTSGRGRGTGVGTAPGPTLGVAVWNLRGFKAGELPASPAVVDAG